jgi:hypothetical protein
MSETPEKRRLRNERMKSRMAADPEYAAKQREKHKQAKKKYEAKKRFERESAGLIGSGKPGRIVALCGWMNW